MMKRKNGRPSSCEPCRIAKLRCDHTRPVCGRCSRKGKPNGCVYHPAPLTHAKRADTDSHGVESRRDLITTITHKNTLLAGQWKRYRVAATVGESSNKLSTPSTSSTGLGPQASIGFLGSTSYWADFDENDRASPRTAVAWSTKAGSTPAPESETANFSDHGQVESGAQILALLFEDVSLYETIIRRQLDSSCIWVLGWPIIAAMFNSIDRLRGNLSLSKTVQTPADLTALSQTLFENSRRLTQTWEESTTMAEFIEATFPRWEMIGLLFAAIGTAVATLPKGHDIIQYDESTIVDADKLARMCADIVEICLGFCNTGVVTDGLSWLLLQQLMLLTHVYGDRGMYE